MGIKFFVTALALGSILLVEPATKSTKIAILEDFINTQETLRYQEAFYQPLGRSVVVDAVLEDPFYLPQYGKKISEDLKNNAVSLYSLSTTAFTAGGSLPVPVPLPEEQGTELMQYWESFVKVYYEIEEILSVLSPAEKEWLRNNYEAFFFGGPEKQLEYDFFTTNSPMPLRFYELASKIDLHALTQCSLKLAAIVDDVHRNAEELSQINLPHDFILREHGLTFVVSSRSGVVHCESADFFIDLGHNNTFYNNAGGTEGKRAAALHISLFGNSTFVGKNFVQGSGFLGVGILASFGGSNKFFADSYSQACGFFGVGMLMNCEGDNHFELNFGGQSFALFGSSLLWNAKGHNFYQANAGMAQAASSTLGVAFLVDQGGYGTYLSGSGKGGKLHGGIGQGASAGVRHDIWTQYPSLYGGVSFLYVQGGHNSFSTPWLGQGSAYFLSLGVLVGEGSHDRFKADYDAQGQGLHLAAGLLFKRGGHDYYDGGWGSLGVGGDRSVGFFINTGGHNYYRGTDQSIGTARKPKGLGVFIDLGGQSTYEFKNLSNANVQKPENYPWPRALFLTLGGGNHYPEGVDQYDRGENKVWGDGKHGFGVDMPIENQDKEKMLFSIFQRN